MIRGRVDAQRQALVQLEIQRSDSLFETIEAVVDTGFDGQLTLPSQTIGELGLEQDQEANVILATGSQETLNAWNGSMLWHDQLRDVQVLEANGVPLLGMELMEDSQLTIQPRINGSVLIERLNQIGP
jgi:clan AA aspartic protease